MLVAVAACDPGSTQGAATSDTTLPDPTSSGAPIDVEVDFSTSFQRITGFGASSAWTAPHLTEDVATLFFSEVEGIGLSLLRVRISPEGTTEEFETAKQATGLGARVWASPWSPPAEWKSNGDVTQGGSLLEAHYGDWALRLSAFAKSMSDEGVALLGLSAQNEPDWTAEWETCRWQPSELAKFVSEHLGPALERVSPGTKVIAPETKDWTTLSTYANQLLSAAETRVFLGTVATHGYGGSAFAYDAPGREGLDFWQTEYTDEGGVDRGMTSGLRVAYEIHQSLTVANVNAWHYWWLLANSSESNSALFIEGEMTRRGYAIGNWSRFVRPGSIRIAATARPQTGVFVSAFRAPERGRFVIVVGNSTNTARRQVFRLSGAEVAAEVTPWVTSPSRALEAVDAVAVVDDRFQYDLEPMSVTTFVGEAPGLIESAP
jgi:glucuronoarabinoxylan endo-1,4-beta-xylanase